ncbi:unnamed protein product, partial [Rotaria socialis]
MDPNEVYPYVRMSGNSEYPLQLAPKNWQEPPYNQMSRLSQPQYRPSDQNQLVRMNAWEDSTMGKPNEINKPTNANSTLTCQKLLAKVTSSKMLFLMTGFIVCGIPLAVFVTLWANSRSTSTTTASSTVSVTAATVS